MTGTSPARRHILIAAAPVGFGPASKAWLIAQQLRQNHSITITCPGDAGEFLEANVGNDITIVKEAFCGSFPDHASLASFDAVISINQTVAITHLASLGLAHRSIFIDSLASWRGNLNEAPLPTDLLAHIVQDYPGANGPLSQYASSETVIVAPIIHRMEPNTDRKGIIIHTGGMAVPEGNRVPFRQATANLFSQVLQAAFKRTGDVTILGNPNAIDQIPDLGRTKILANANPAEAVEAIGKAELLITTPGIGAIYEAMSQETPIIMLPPTNSTQIFHYQILTGHGLVGTLNDKARGNLQQVTEQIAWQNHKPFLIQQLARGTSQALVQLGALLDAYLDKDHDTQRNEAVRKGRTIMSGLSTLPAAEAIEAALARLSPASATLAVTRPRASEMPEEQARDPLGQFVASLPKVELHLHLEGALPPDFVLGLARRNRISLPFKDITAFLETPAYADFRAFANRLLFNAHCLQTPQDFEDAVFVMGEGLRRSRVRYAEVMWTPQLYLNRPIGLDEILAALDRGRARVSEAFGIELRWIIDLVRSFPGPAPQIAQWACRSHTRGLGVVALGLGGPEAGHPARPFAACFDLARREGFGSNPHAGENAGPDSIVEVLDLLKPDRIAHGIRATEDVSLMARIAEQRIVLDVCPTSNVTLGVRANFAQLRLAELRKAGCRFTLNTDDPTLFGTNLNNEYRIAMEECGLDASAIGECIATSVESARLDDGAKERLRAEILPEVAQLVQGYRQSVSASPSAPSGT